MQSLAVTLLRSNTPGPLIGLLSVSITLLSTGCASRPYPENNGGDASPLFIYLVPLILANEVALFAIEKKKESAAEAHEAELLSQVHRFEELKALSVKGDSAIQCELAFCYLRGRGAIRDVGQATFWFQQSARQGFVEAQNELGLCYYNEIGVRRDDIEACAWWSLAAPTHEQAKQSLVYVESNTEKRLTKEAFAAFRTSVRRRAEEICNR